MITWTFSGTSCQPTDSRAARDHIFVFPSVIEKQILRGRGVKLIGRIPSVVERYYVISVERKLKHPAVVAICDAARRSIFG